MTDDLKDLEKLSRGVIDKRLIDWVWKGISFLLLVLYLAELGGWFSQNEDDWPARYTIHYGKRLSREASSFRKHLRAIVPGETKVQ